MKYPSIRKVLGDNIKYYRFKMGYYLLLKESHHKPLPKRVNLK